MDRPHLDIQFVSDVACPWCAIGLASLDEAIGRIGPGIEVSVRPEPFELNPDMGPAGDDVVAYLGRKYGRSPDEVAEVQERIRARGAAVGFAFGRREHVWNTLAAHRVLHWAATQGRAIELKRALLRAYHGEGRNPGAPEVLEALAKEVGLDGAKAREIAEGDAFTDEVRERERHWIEQGVNGVPFIVVNGKYAIEGGQPPEVFEEALRRILAAG